MGIGIGLSINASAQSTPIPNWIKNTAKWWADDQISDSEFIKALQWLIDQKILVVEQYNATKELQDKIALAMLNNLENKPKTPPPVEIGYDCLKSLGETWKNPDDHGYVEYHVTVQNFDKILHSATVKVSDETDGGNILSSKNIEVVLQPNETKKVTETLAGTALSDGLCHVELTSVKQ